MVLGGVATSGEAINVVPGSFRFSVDRRVRTWESHDAAREELLSACVNVSEAIGNGTSHSTCTIVNEVRGFATPIDHPLIAIALGIARDVGNLSLQTELLAGFMDLGHFAHAGARAGFALGPGRNDQPHVANESVALSDLEAVTDTIAATLVAIMEDTRRAPTSAARVHH
jgi:succinyl-diaminopimelate desuccinylase